jgi:hypothetical protein
MSTWWSLIGRPASTDPRDLPSIFAGAVLLVVGAVAVVTGALPLADLAALVDRVAPILLFVVAMTVVTELAGLPPLPTQPCILA